MLATESDIIAYEDSVRIIESMVYCGGGQLVYKGLESEHFVFRGP